LHFAITGSTAAEIIYARADGTKDNMGLKLGRMLQKDKYLKRMFLCKELTG